MSRLSCLAVACSGCWGTATPVVQHVAPPGEPPVIEPVIDASCVREPEMIPFDDGARIEVVICPGEEHHDENNPDMTWREHSAALVVHGRHAETFPLGSYEAGWEWGGSWTLSGVLRSATTSSVVLVVESGYSEDSHHAVLHVYRRSDGWVEVETFEAAEITVELAEDHRSARVTRCDAEEVKCHTTTLRWNGKQLDAR